MRTDLHASGDTVVLNTLGELDAVFPLADVVVMGRSFGHRYGSDPMGPAAAGKPTLIGPNHEDFLTAVNVLKTEGALQVVLADELPIHLADLTSCQKTLTRMGEAGERVAKAAQGVACMLAKEIALQTQPPRRDRGGAEEKEESVHQSARSTSAAGGLDDQK